MLHQVAAGCSTFVASTLPWRNSAGFLSAPWLRVQSADQGCTVTSAIQAGKFVLDGEEIDLGVGPQASMAQRVEALRVLLEQRLGLDIFMK